MQNATPEDKNATVKLEKKSGKHQVVKKIICAHDRDL